MSSNPRFPVYAAPMESSSDGVLHSGMERQVHALAAVPRYVSLKGRNVGLLCDDPSQPEPMLVCRAAIELGAHVSLVRPRLEDVDAEKAADTARMLGRLYDAIVCVALAPDLVLQLRERAEIPVLDDSSIGAPHTRQAPVRIAGVSQPHIDDRKMLWQAALVASLG